MHNDLPLINAAPLPEAPIRITPPSPPDHFIEITRRDFYCKFWPKYKKPIEAIRSNFQPAKGKPRELPIYVFWGMKPKDEQPPQILAVVIADEEAERYWVDPDAMK